MQILHIIDRLAEADGGPPQGMLALAKAQATFGDNVVILPCSSSGGRMLIEPDKYGNLTILKPPTAASLKLPSAALNAAINDAAQGVDIIHIHGTWRYHLVAAGNVARKLKIPFIISPEGDLGRIPRRYKWYLKKLFFQLVEKSIFNNASAIHCYTTKELREIKDMKFLPRHFVVPQPVETSLLDMAPDATTVQKLCPNIDNNSQVLLYLGRLVWIKRLPLLIEAFIKISDEFKNSHVILAGPWEDQRLVDEIKARIAQVKLESRIHLPGMVRGGVKVAILQLADVFVQPSFHENFGISVAEAFLFGKPCIVSEGVALADEISEFHAGLVFSGGVDELASALRKILTNEVMRYTYGENAKKLANNFEPNSVAEKFHKEYELCIKIHTQTLKK
jgi:glycosyltransferase involved in cell wall biosynthesis